MDVSFQMLWEYFQAQSQADTEYVWVPVAVFPVPKAKDVHGTAMRWRYTECSK